VLLLAALLGLGRLPGRVLLNAAMLKWQTRSETSTGLPAALAIAADLTPSDLRICWQAGRWHAEAGDWQTGSLYWEQCPEALPQLLLAGQILGEADGDWTQALNWFQAGIQIDPQNPAGYVWAGKAYYNLGRFTVSRTQFEHAVELEAENIDALIYLGRIGQEEANPEQAERWFLRALEVAPNNFEVNFSAGNFFRSIQTYPQAAYYLEKAVQIMPGHTQAQMDLGAAYFQSGDFARAEAIWLQIAERSPSYSDVWLGLAELYAESGDRESAVLHYCRVIAIGDPADAQLSIEALQALGTTCP